VLKRLKPDPRRDNLRQFTRLLSALRVTPRIFAPRITVSPSGSRHSWRTSRPKWGGFFIFMVYVS
jgi:hypothetical protein